MSSVRDRGAIHLGLDVHKNTISVGLLEPDAELPIVEKISSDDEAVRRLISRFEDLRRLRVSCEAGPTGYELARLLASLGGVRGDRSDADPDRCGRAGQNRYA
jgi:hypothetical protein